MSLLFACDTVKEEKINRSIKVQSKEELKTLNPLSISDAFSNYVCMLIYQPLLAIDYETNELVGVLAESRPNIEVKGDKLQIDYTIRKDAEFDESTPVEAKDILFSLKLNVCPFVNPFYASYYKFIDSLIFINDTSKEFTIYGNGRYHLNEFASGDYFILSKNKLDPQGILDNYSIRKLKTVNEDSSEKELVEFLNKIKEHNFLNDQKPFGSGAYTIQPIENDLSIRIHKKDNWWGNKIQSNCYFSANAEKVEFAIIKDDITALNALKAREIDVFPNLPPKEYSKLVTDSSFLNSFYIDTVKRNAYFYIGFNLLNDNLKDINLRKAIAFAIPVRDIIINLEYNLASNLNAPFKTNLEKESEFSLNPYHFNKDSVVHYLNLFRVNNGWMDKPINLSYSYNSGNKTRESIGLILKQSLAVFNVNLELKAYEWSVYLEKLKEGDMELFINGASTSTLPPDFASSFHSESAMMGRNYANYKNPIADSLIEIINSDLNEKSRNRNIAKFQKLINQELPYYFLYKPKRIIVFSNKLGNASAYEQRPNYWVPSLKWK